MPERFTDWLTAGKPHVTRLSVAAGISTRTLTAPGKALIYE
ncbi:unknown [Prevotella sp. CAG:1058]|nr:unknown [Prevotella sp. CAG:1058]